MPRCACILACACCLLAGCGGSAPDLSAPPPVVSVETVRARVAQIEDVVTTQGLLYPLHQASLSPKISAPVRRFYVQRGSRVHVGQLLAVLDNKDLAAGVLSARGSYDQAQANYATAVSSTVPEQVQGAALALKDAKANLESQQKLYDSESKLYKQGAIARKQLDATEVALVAAESAQRNAEKRFENLKSSGAADQRKAAKGQLEAAHGQYLNAAAQLGYTELRSPIDGSVADRAVYPGDIAPAGTPLLIIMDTSKVIVRLHIPQPEAARLKLGDAASVHVPGIDPPVSAKVTVISPAVDPNSTTVEVWIEADNPKGRLQPGTSVGISVVTETIPQALVVPDTAILTDADGETRVMIVGPGSLAHAQPVKTGVRQGSLIQVVSGLRPGVEVIASGAYGLPDKTKVKPTPASSQSGSS